MSRRRDELKALLGGTSQPETPTPEPQRRPLALARIRVPGR